MKEVKRAIAGAANDGYKWTESTYHGNMQFGGATININPKWFSSGPPNSPQKLDFFAHEIGHGFYLTHAWAGSGSLMSYDKLRSLQQRDFQNLLQVTKQRVAP